MRNCFRTQLSFIVVTAIMLLFSCSSRQSETAEAVTAQAGDDMVEVGLAGTDGKITALASHENILYVGGEFSVAGTVFAENVAQWNGNEWAAVGDGFGMPVTAMACDSTGMLYVAGTVRQKKGRAGYGGNPGSAAFTNIRRWNGNTWEKIGTVINGRGAGYIHSLACNVNGRLFAAGKFGEIDGCKSRNIAWWDGKDWYPVSDGKGFPLRENTYSGDAVSSIAPDTGGGLYVIHRKLLAYWDGADFRVIGRGPDGNPLALIMGKNGKLVAGGEFRTRAGQTAQVAYYNGGTWEYSPATRNNRVLSLVYGGVDRLYAGNNLSVFSVDDTVVQKDPGINHGTFSALAYDGRGTLYAAGHNIMLKNSDHFPVTVIRREGNKWNRVRTMAPRTGNEPVRPPEPLLPKDLPLPDSLERYKIKAFTVAPDGQVYISGNFEIILGKECLTRLGRWDGKKWHAVGAGLPAAANALAADRFGNLYAGGRFPDGGWNSYNQLLRWDGSSWQAIKKVRGRISALACDWSGYLYYGISLPPKADPMTRRLFIWDDSTITPVYKGPVGCLRNYAHNGSIATISQLDVVGSTLHVQGDFTVAADRVCQGYAVYDLGDPDVERIKTKEATQRRIASAKTKKSSAEVRVAEAYCHLGVEAVVQFEKYEVTNTTSSVIDSAVLYTSDTSGFLYDKKEWPWAAPPAITADSSGFRCSYSLSTPLKPGTTTKFWVKKKIPGHVHSTEPGVWIYRDTLAALFNDLSPASERFNRKEYALSVIEYDSFTVHKGTGHREDQHFVVMGSFGKPFEICFSLKSGFDPACKEIIRFINMATLINEYTPAPRSLLPEIRKCARVTQEQLGRTLLQWCLSFGQPVGIDDLWDMIGEDPDGTVPEPAELKRRFNEMTQFYLDILAVLVPSLKQDTYMMVTEMIGNWRVPDCGFANSSAEEPRLEDDIIYCSEEGDGSEPKMGFYPMVLIRKTLKLLGPAAGDDREVFEMHFR